MSVLVGRKAPDCTAQAIVNGKIESRYSLTDLRGRHVLLFFYPLDFTFVCPTELHAFQDRLADFEARNTQVVGCSVDSVYSHMAWLQKPRSQGGIEGVKYPLLADLNKTIARSFGVLKEEDGIAYRGLFLIDREGIVRHQVVNDLPLGRSVDEALRMVDALLCFEQHGEVCPANWSQGAKAMTPSQEGLVAYFRS